ncbi:MAG: penicillin-binding transpeptidase domain-containing protein, partial [Verrucomicrobiota bacterium]
MAIKVKRKREVSLLVIWVVFGLMIMGMGVLVSNLWKLQVRAKGSFDDQLFEQSVRRIRLPAVRGKIYDTNGDVLADSVPNYCIAIYTEELFAPKSMVAKTLELVHEIWMRVGRKPDVSYRDILRHLHFSPQRPMTVYKNLTPEETRKWRIEFEKWTAPPKGWSKRYKIPGLKLKDPVIDGRIIIQTAELEKRATSTAANTLELVYKIYERLNGHVDMEELPVGLRAIKRHIRSQRPVPLLAWKHLDQETIAKWADTCSDLTATDIYCLPARTYPEGENLAHLIGFTREADTVKQDGNEPFHYDVRGIKGRKGLEGLYNGLLEGEPGYQLVQIDADGFHHRDLQTIPSLAGGDLQLTIDRNIQQFAKEALTMHLETDPFKGPVKGAVVVLDPNNGDVLAMVSSPLFDPNKYMTSGKYVQSLMTNTNAPTLNRAVYGQYAPGSTFKPVACLGVLREHPEYAEEHHDCPGYHMVGKRRMHCHSTHGEKLSMRQTLEKSCNAYMYQMAIEIGYDPIYRMAKDFGLGQPVGLFPDVEDLSGSFMTKGSKYGNLPEKAVGLAGACNLSIGQGEIVVAPLQMAMVAATIANGGHLYRPRLIKKFRFAQDRPYDINPTSKIRYIPIPGEALEIVRGGMHDVVMGGREAAKCVQVGDIVIAGKTGTAEYGPKKLGKKNTWMISYAPFDFPRYAVAFIVQDGVYGGTTVAPRLHELYSKIFHYDGTL